VWWIPNRNAADLLPLATLQLTQRPVTTPRPQSTTPLRQRVLYHHLHCHELLPRPEVLFCPELHHQGTGHCYVCCPILRHRGSQVLLFLATTPKCSSTTLPDLHNHNRGGQLLRSPDLLHRSCSFITTLNRNTIVMLSLLHHNLLYT
jgi:hypothetical protein